MMQIIIIVLLSIKVAYFFELNLTNHINKGLIANGIKYDAEKYPYVVTIITTTHVIADEYEETVCTGSLVKELYVLTAAHCLYNLPKSNMQVFLGSKLGNNFRNVAKLYIPEKYVGRDKKKENDWSTSYDIGVIKLENAFSDVKQFIKIGGEPKEFEKYKPIECTCIGFGSINDHGDNGFEGKMITTNVTYGRAACRGYDHDMIQLHWDEYLCSAAGRLEMVCQGDSGGPMICNGKLYGVGSFIFNYKGGNVSCGGPGMQGVHTFVYHHLKWVNDIIDPEANKKKKKKKKQNNSGNLIKPHLELHTILTILLYSVLTILGK